MMGAGIIRAGRTEPEVVSVFREYFGNEIGEENHINEQD